MTRRLACLAALPLLATRGAPAADVPALEAANCLLADVLQDKRGRLQELLHLARAQGVELSGAVNLTQIEAFGLAQSRPRKLTEEHEGDHHMLFRSWDNDTSIMLLGMISFVMVLFYLTNWPDDDIRFYSWQITSITISIFCAVLTFNGFNQLIRAAFEEPEDIQSTKNAMIMCILHFIHCFMYLALMHLGTGFESGLIGSVQDEDALVSEAGWVYADALQCTNDELVPAADLCNIRAVSRGDDDAMRSVILIPAGETQKMEVPVQKKQHRLIRRKRRTKALAMLLAHMAGFAAIFSGTSLQRVFHELNTGYSEIVCWIPLIINQFVIQLAFKVSECVRHNTVKSRHAKNEQKTWTDQDQKKRAEEGLELIEEMMTEEIVESENDVSSLSMSYLFVNVIRLLLTSELPDVTGEEPEGWKPNLFRHAVALYGIGLVLVLLACVQAIAMQKFNKQIKDKSTRRILNTILNATAMCFAWCVLWATHWTVEWWCDLTHWHPARMRQKVVIAFVLTAFAAGMVFAVDVIDDKLEEAVMASETAGGGSQENKKEVDAESRELLSQPKQEESQSAHQLAREMIRIVVTSLGILVGFSWEHCFDGGVESVSEKAQPMFKVWFQLVLGILVCILVLPAWRKHILQKVMLMQEMRDAEEANSAPKHASSRVSNDGSELST